MNCTKYSVIHYDYKVPCNALDGANKPGKKEATSALAAENAPNHMGNNRNIQWELVFKQLFTYDSMQEREFHSVGMDAGNKKVENILIFFNGNDV